MSEKPQPQSYPLRMPIDLREQIEKAAELNKRSLNAEILARLEESLNANSTHNNPETELLHKLYQESSERLADLEKTSNMGSMEVIELNSERATNTMLRHLLARHLSEQ